MLRWITLIVTLLWTASAARAQAVQLPSVDVFSVDTVVSVPDRGSMFLGGVRSQAQGRSTAGPLRSGTAWGQASAASSASTQVWIHDFEAMDAALLAEGRAVAPTTAAPPTRADLARAHLARTAATTGSESSSRALSKAAAPRPTPNRTRPLAPASHSALRSTPRSPTVQPLQYNLIR